MRRAKLTNRVSKMKPKMTSSAGSETLSVLRQHTMSLDHKIMYLTMHDNESSEEEPEQLPSIHFNNNKRRPSYDSKMKLINEQKSFSAKMTRQPALSSASSDWTGKTRNTSLLVCPSISDSTMNLMEAAEKGDATAVRKAIQNRNNPHDNEYRLALQKACQYGQTDVVEQLLQAGADPNLRSTSGRTLLQEACIGGHPNVVKILVDFVDDVNAVDKEGQSACHAAGFHGEVECLQVLEEKGADCSLQDNKGRTPAHLASQRNHPRILEFLLTNGMDIEIPDAKQKKPIHYAAIHGGLECLLLFAQSDCNNVPTDGIGCIPAHYTASHNHIDCLRFMVKHGSDKEAQDGTGRTLAHMAASKGAMTCLHWLFEKGANANAIDHLGNTSAHLAAAGGHGECFNCCIQHDTNMEVTNEKNETPMDTARRFGHPLLMTKAGNNEVRCVHCNDNYEMAEWEKSHQSSQVQKAMKKAKGTVFNNPLPVKQKHHTRAQLNSLQRHAKEVKAQQQRSMLDKGGLPTRDLAAKYFGRENADPFN